MKQDFRTDELRAELERSLGFPLRSLERLDGASALNFKAVRDSDGFAFAVKLSPFSRQGYFDALTEHLEAVKSSKAVRRVFERECPGTFRGCNVICMAWCSGERMFPDRLSDSQFLSMLDDYEEFSKAMQRARILEEARPVRQWRLDALERCRGFSGMLLRRAIESLTSPDCDYRPELLRAVHGDFHHGNFLFVDGKVSGFFDLEEFRYGYPADDILRYISCAFEHLRPYELSRKRRVLHMFGLAVRHLPYSRHEWIAAIHARYIIKIRMRTQHPGAIGVFRALNLAWRAGFYRAMRKIVDDNVNGHS